MTLAIMSSHISTSHFVSALTAGSSSILRMRQQRRLEWTTKLFRKPGQQQEDTSREPDLVVRQVRQTTWPEMTRLFNTGLAGFWSMAVFLVVGFAACHVTGPSVIMSVVITAITSVLTGLCTSALVTRPNMSCGHPATVVFQLLGEFPSFILSWLDILLHLTMVSACSRAMTATLDKTGDSWFHDLVLETFGLTPFVNTFPDFMAGGAVMITALFIAAGMEESQTLRRWLNIATGCALGFITIVGIWKANPETLKSQPFLLDGSNGVVLSACILSVVFGGGVQMCQAAKKSSQPHRLVPLANGMSQLAMTLTLLMIAVILPMLARLSPTGLVPEVPLLQAFENEVGRGWTRLVIAVLTIVCLCFSLLELSLPLHRMVQQLVSDGLLFRWLGMSFSKTSTPFLGSVVIGSLTATLATLADVSWLLVTGSAAKITFDLSICTCSLLVHYGVGLPQCTSKDEDEEKKEKRAASIRRKIQRRRKRKRKSDLRTISSTIAHNLRDELSSGPMTGHASTTATTATTTAASDDALENAFDEDVASSSQTQPKARASNGAKPVVDAAEKVIRGSYLDKGLAKMRMMFGSHQVLQANDEEFNQAKTEDTETETESSPSGYGTETSADSSTDTDIDAIVNEYRDEASLPTTMREYPASAIKGPNKATANVVKMATVVLLLSFVLQFVILDNVKTSTIINAVILNLGISVAVFVLLLVISKQPIDKSRGRTDFTFIMPLAPWSHALAIFFNLSLLARVLHSVSIELILWLLLGCVTYFCYGINHSIAASRHQEAKNRFHRERPNTLMLSPVVPISSISSVSGSSNANYQTPTFDLTTLSTRDDERSSIVKNKRQQYAHQPLLEK